MERKRFLKKQLPAAVALSLGVSGPLPAQVQNPCAAGPRVENPCAAAPRAANPCAAGPRKAANPCAAAGRKAPPAANRGAAARPWDVSQDWPQAPFGDAMPAIVENYGRAAPYVGTGGLISAGAMPTLKEKGFTTVISLLTGEEAGDQARQAEQAGLKYVRIGVSTLAPTRDQVERFAELVEDESNYPLLVHCSSSNRVGALWALYRARQGVPPEIAIQEGRTVGLKPSREGAVRERLDTGNAP